MTQANHLSRFPTLVAFRRQGQQLLDWWLSELGALIPTAIRRWWLGTGDALLLSPHGANIRLARPTSTGIEEVLVAPPDSREWRRLGERSVAGRMVFLALPRDQVLRRTLVLPAALAENLRQSLAFELDRYTPFRPDQAYFDYRAGACPNAPASIQVDLLVASRKTVDEHVRQVSGIGIKLSGVVLSDDFSQPGSDFRNLLPPAEGARRPAGHLGLRLAFLALATLLTVTLLTIPVWQKRGAAIALLEPVAQAKQAAQEADARRSQLAKLAEQHDLLPNMKWNSPSVTAMIEELTKLLPDDTFVMQFDFDGKTVQIIGETASSTGLVETIERSSLFKDVAFKSPLTKIQGSAFDRFHLGANIEASAPAIPAPSGEGASKP